MISSNWEKVISHESKSSREVKELEGLLTRHRGATSMGFFWQGELLKFFDTDQGRRDRAVDKTWKYNRC